MGDRSENHMLCSKLMNWAGQMDNKLCSVEEVFFELRYLGFGGDGGVGKRKLLEHVNIFSS